jgi:hypothetical protein
VDFKLAAQPWKETQVRLEDGSGRPVAGVEATCSLGRVMGAHDNLACRAYHTATDPHRRLSPSY